MLRKQTVFIPCDKHEPRYASETRYRRAEVMVEGGWESAPCDCHMRPGTDFYATDFVAQNPVYYASR